MIRYQGKIYQIARADIRGGLRGAKVRVEQRLDGTVAVRFRDRYLAVSVCEPPAQAKPAQRRLEVKQTSTAASRLPSRRWMEGFSLKHSPPLWKILKQETVTGVPAREGR